MLSDLFEQAGDVDRAKIFGIRNRSVDGYQGRKVIVFSQYVPANMETRFFSNKRRLNVALTRAKRGLVIIGNPNTLRHNKTWNSWLDWVAEKFVRMAFVAELMRRLTSKPSSQNHEVL